MLNQITDNNDDNLDKAEKSAIGSINDMLSGYYNINAELAKSGDNRHSNLLKWMINLALYFVYSRIPDDEIPERVIKDYDDTMKTLEKIATGKTPTTLQAVTVDGEKKRVFRMGSKKVRSQNIL